MRGVDFVVGNDAAHEKAARLNEYAFKREFASPPARFRMKSKVAAAH